MHILRIFWREIMKLCVRSSYVQKLHELKPMAFSFRGLYPSCRVRNLLGKSINYKPATVSRESSTNALATRRDGTEKTWTDSATKRHNSIKPSGAVVPHEAVLSTLIRLPRISTMTSRKQGSSMLCQGCSGKSIIMPEELCLVPCLFASRES